jgi:hypothetical protein
VAQRWLACGPRWARRRMGLAPWRERMLRWWPMPSSRSYQVRTLMCWKRMGGAAPEDTEIDFGGVGLLTYTS